ncbi:hypothetical protein MKZ38_005823 [Zalerion maritima]|uniref:Uncharacterized protein n=1 Tax=Zalerion maritima TaxID=339359 RepID=A0AAD5RXI6_9PEZI|nr:hypothetical protein MKZ38_005823 [Zalerion maritima]
MFLHATNPNDFHVLLEPGGLGRVSGEKPEPSKVGRHSERIGHSASDKSTIPGAAYTRVSDRPQAQTLSGTEARIAFKTKWNGLVSKTQTCPPKTTQDHLHASEENLINDYFEGTGMVNLSRPLELVETFDSWLLGDGCISDGSARGTLPYQPDLQGTKSIAGKVRHILETAFLVPEKNERWLYPSTFHRKRYIGIGLHQIPRVFLGDVSESGEDLSTEEFEETQLPLRKPHFEIRKWARSLEQDKPPLHEPIPALPDVGSPIKTRRVWDESDRGEIPRETALKMSIHLGAK